MTALRPWLIVLFLRVGVAEDLTLTCLGKLRDERDLLRVVDGKTLEHHLRLSFDQLHSKYLSTREARMATELRMAYLRVGQGGKSSELVLSVPAPDFKADFDFLMEKIEEYRVNWKRFPWGTNKVSSDRQTRVKASLDRIHAVLMTVKERAAKRGHPNYGEMLTALEGARRYCRDWEGMRDPILSQASFSERRGYAMAFEVMLPIRNPEGAHLGFRAFNDRGAVATSVVEIPHLKIGESLQVDGGKYNFADFIGHDMDHAVEMLSDYNQETALSAETGLPRLDDEGRGDGERRSSNLELLGNYLRHLEARAQRYDRVRNYIDSIQDKRMRTLAEGVWFVLDHELNLAYRSDQEAINLKNKLVRSPKISQFILDRFSKKGDLGQAFKDPGWIQASHIDELLQEFGSISGLNFLDAEVQPQR